MQKSVPVALVYGESESSQGLRDALGQIGAEVVCDIDVDGFNVDSLGASGAGVVLISLDGVIETRLDEIYGALDEDRYRVMFDDPEISNSLDGWEQARWQRHLAAKLRDIADWDPPRPDDAKPVQVAANQTADAPAEGEHAAQPEWMEEALSVLGGSDTLAEAAGTEQVPEDAGAVAQDSAQLTEGIDLVEGVDEQAAEPAASQPADPFDFELPDNGNAPESPPPQPALESDSSPALEAVPDPASPTETAPEPDAEDFDELAAQLDALADAEDPLAALSALAGDGETEAAAGAEDVDPLDVASSDDLPEPGIMAADAFPDGEPGSQPEPAENTEMPAGPDDDDSEDPDWAALEAELNAAFDSDTMGAIDAAVGTGESALAATDEIPGDGTDESRAGEFSLDAEASTSPAADAESSSAANVAAKVEAEAEPEAPPAVDAESASTQTGDAASDSGSELPDASLWALVDDEPLAQEQDDASAAPEPEAEPAVAQDETRDSEAAPDEVADEGFKLELVDPIDYLKPEAPPEDISTELFNMPSLMPMAEAVAHRTGEDADAPRDTRSPVERVVVLAASIGGPDAVREFLSHLPQQLPATVLLVQHLGSEFVDLMVSQLAKSSALPVRIPGRAEHAVHGEVLIVPSGSAVELGTDGQLVLKVVEGATANDPSIKRTLTMAAENFGADATAIIFSGMAAGVAEGATEISSRGGEIWVQDPDSCVVSKMVDEVIEAGVSRFIGNPEALAQKLVAHLQETADNAPDQ